MTTKQNKQNSELLEIKTFISDRFDELKSELKNDIAAVKHEVDQIKTQTTDLDKKLAVIEFGELKNWRQTAFVIIAGVVSAFLGWLARGSKVY
jgi:hypothetical protein